MDMIRRKISLLAVLAVLAASFVLNAGCGFLPEEEEELAPPLMDPITIKYETQALTRGTLIQQLRISGSFYPEVQRNLSFEKQGGRLKSILVSTGQNVKAGDVIAELDAESLVSSIWIQEKAVQKAQLSVTRLQANHADSYSIKKAKLDLQMQQIRLEDLKRQYEVTRIVAPISGRIVYLISLSVGELIDTDQIVARIADNSALLLATTSDKASDLPIGALVDSGIPQTAAGRRSCRQSDNPVQRPE